ncbi:MAG: DNA polymerase IV [Planctomycetota bacterium]
MILHVDMDAFFASVEMREDPSLVGKPVIVGGSSARGVVSAANYEARKFGVHSAMPGSKARRLCPDGVFLRGNMELYAEVSRQIRDVFRRYTPLVQPLSLDEAFLDVTGSVRLFGPPAEIGRRIRDDIAAELRLPASVGVAPNKFLAKIASDLEKPRGFTVVDPDRVQEFLDPLPVRKIWGVGKVAGRKLGELGVETIRDLRLLSEGVLEGRFGVVGRKLAELSRGIDDRSVVPDHEAKSISHETTFSTDVTDADSLRAWLRLLGDQVARRLRRHGRFAKTVQLKIRYDDFDTFTRAETLPEPTDRTDLIWEAADRLFTHKRPTRNLSVRLIGVGVSGLSTGAAVQRSLFDEEGQKRRGLDHTADRITERFGSDALRPASALGLSRKRPTAGNESENTDDLRS